MTVDAVRGAEALWGGERAAKKRIVEGGGVTDAQATQRLRDHPAAADHREGADHDGARTSTRSRSTSARTSCRSRKPSRSRSASTSRDVNTCMMKGKRRRYGRGADQAAGLEEGGRDARTRREDRTVRGRVAMAVKQFKPTSPGRRGSSGFTFEEITKKTPEKSLLATRKQHGRPQQRRARSPCATAAAARSAASASSTSSATRPACPAASRRSSTTPGARRASRSIFYRDGEKRYIIAPVGLKVGDNVQSRRRRRSARRQHAAAAEHAERHRHPQHRADAGPRRPDRRAAPARRRS